MTDIPDEPTRSTEFAPLEDVSRQPDPYAPVDYPSTASDLPPSVYPGPYPHAPAVGYPLPPGYPPRFGPPPYAGGYPYAADPYDPYRRMQQPGNNGKATAALVTSLVGLPFCCLFIPSIVGIVLGVIAMNEIKQTGQPGHGMALAGVIVGGVTAALTILFWIIRFATLQAYPYN